MTPQDTSKDDGIFGRLNYVPKLTEALEKERERLMREYPAVYVKIKMANSTDKRWNKWENYNGNPLRRAVKRIKEIF